jgi:hypothetical protein
MCCGGAGLCKSKIDEDVDGKERDSARMTRKGLAERKRERERERGDY